MKITLAETVSELWKELADTIKELEEQTSSEDEPYYQGRGIVLPADQPKIESFWRTPRNDDTDTTQTTTGTIHQKTQFRRQIRPQQPTNTPHYKHNPIQNTTYTTQHGGLIA